MPLDDDFSVDDDIVENAGPTEEEIAAARRIVALADGAEVEVFGNSAGARGVDLTPTASQPNRAERRKKVRQKKSVVPASAPEPQDHLPKQDPRAAEVANGSTIVLTLWDKEVRVAQSDLLNSWDFQIGVAQGNPMLMVKGLLGPKLFGWFAVRAQGDGKTPMEAASEIVSMFNRQTGFDSSGK